MMSQAAYHSETADPVKLLEQLPLFYDFTHDEIKKVAAIALEVFFEPRQSIYRAGDRGERVYLVLSGLVRMAPRNDEETTPDDFIVRSRGIFGEDCACDDSPRGLSAMALMRTHCLALTRVGLQRLEDQHPRVALKLLRKFARTTGQRLRQAVAALARTPVLVAPATAPEAPASAALVNRTLGHFGRAMATLSTVRKPKAV